MNWVDAAIIGFVVVYALAGLRRGFLSVASDLAALSVGFLLALLAFRPLGGIIAASQPLSRDSGEVIAFVAVWVVVTFVTELILRQQVKKIPKETREGTTNRVLGLIPSALKGLVGAVLLVAVLGARPDWKLGADVETSLLARPMLAVARSAQGVVFGEFGGALQDFNRSRGVTGIVEGSKPLGFKTTNGKVNAEAEARMLVLLNEERQRSGLRPLVMDNALREVARIHAKDMLARGYFAHVSPDGVDPFDRLRSAGITYTAAGENLAKAPNVEIAHSGLMDSPGHRKNILTPEYGRVGIGAVDAGLHGIVFAQEFAD